MKNKYAITKGKIRLLELLQLSSGNTSFDAAVIKPMFRAGIVGNEPTKATIEQGE